MVFLSIDYYPTIEEAEDAYPGYIIIEVEGGWHGFETVEALEIWEMQR